MAIMTTSDWVYGFLIQVDDQVLFRVSKLPDNFVFQSTDGKHYFVTIEGPDFFSRKRIILSDASGGPLAVISRRFFASTLNLNGQTFRIRSKAQSFLTMLFGRQSFEVKEFGVRLDSRSRFMSYEVRTNEDAIDGLRVAIIVLLHYAQILLLRESSG